LFDDIPPRWDVYERVWGYRVIVRRYCDIVVIDGVVKHFWRFFNS